MPSLPDSPHVYELLSQLTVHIVDLALSRLGSIFILTIVKYIGLDCNYLLIRVCVHRLAPLFNF